MAEAFGCSVPSLRIALLGAGGGAGQAAARYLSELNVPLLVLLNRTAAKAEQLAHELADTSETEIRVEPWKSFPQSLRRG